MRGRHSTPIDYQPLTNSPSFFPSMALSQPSDYQHPFKNAPSPLLAYLRQLATSVFTTVRLPVRPAATRSLRFRPFSHAKPSFAPSPRTLSPPFVPSSALRGRSAHTFATFCSLIYPSGPPCVHFHLFLFAQPPFRTARRTLSPLFVRSAVLRGRSAYIFAAICPLICPSGPLGARFRHFLFAWRRGQRRGVRR